LFAFELNHATVVRRGVKALDDVTLAVELGQHTAILGPNGSGKSTLLKLLSGELYALPRQDGEPAVRVFGQTRWNLVDLRSRLGIVSSDLQYRFVAGSSMGKITAMEAVLTGFFSSELLFFHHQVEPWMEERAAKSLATVGASELERRPMDGLSTGEVRRVLLARALVHEPKALILDEPTAGLDVVARHGLLRRLSELADKGITLVLVTHAVEEIIPAIQCVILMQRGRILATGSPSAVLTGALLGKAYEAAIAIRRGDHHFEMSVHSGPGKVKETLDGLETPEDPMRSRRGASDTENMANSMEDA
jgi:iron complex transport system ATP-binding protein